MITSEANDTVIPQASEVPTKERSTINLTKRAELRSRKEGFDL
jgi:hypothetical protein